MPALAIVLIAVGALCLLVPSVTFFTRERVADAGFFAIDVKKPHTLVLNPVVGVIAIVAGVLLLL